MSNMLDVYGCEEQLFLGSKFAPSGAIILLFDCSVGSARGELGDKSPPVYVNSPILASFMAAIEERDDIEVIVIQHPRVDLLKEVTHHLLKAHEKKRKNAFDALNLKLYKQLKTGYCRLAESYCIDSDKSTRKSVLVFGVKEGAIAANALVEMICRTGILMHQFCLHGNNGLFDQYFKEVYNVATTTTGPDSNECKNLIATRTMNMQVDLLGLWYDQGNSRQLRAVGEQKPRVGTVAVESPTPCASCMKYSCKEYCPLRHMIGRVSKACEENEISLHLNSYYIASKIDIQSTNG